MLHFRKSDSSGVWPRSLARHGDTAQGRGVDESHCAYKKSTNPLLAESQRVGCGSLLRQENTTQSDAIEACPQRTDGLGPFASAGTGTRELWHENTTTYHMSLQNEDPSRWPFATLEEFRRCLRPGLPAERGGKDDVMSLEGFVSPDAFWCSAECWSADWMSAEAEDDGASEEKKRSLSKPTQKKRSKPKRKKRPSRPPSLSKPVEASKRDIHAKKKSKMLPPKACECGCGKTFQNWEMIQSKYAAESKYYFVIKTKFIQPAYTCLENVIAHRDEWLAGLEDARAKWNGPGANAGKAAKLTEEELVTLLKGHGKSTNTKKHGRGRDMNATELRAAWLAYCAEEKARAREQERRAKKKRKRN